MIERRFGWMNSIGSSMVRMWPVLFSLRWLIIAASVVDLPEPVLAHAEHLALDLQHHRRIGREKNVRSVLLDRQVQVRQQLLERLRRGGCGGWRDSGDGGCAHEEPAPLRIAPRRRSYDAQR